MAKPITLEILPRDPRRKLISRLESAPVEHAEAILSAYELLQNLHDQHILELLRGLLGSEGKVLEIITDAAKQPEAIRGIRNLVILAKTFGTIDPEVLKNIAGRSAQSAGTVGAPQAIPAQGQPPRSARRE